MSKQILINSHARPSADPPPPSRWRSRQSYACGRRRPPPMTLQRWTRRVVANFWQNFARFRLYRRRSLQVNTRLNIFSIFQNLLDYLAEFFEIWQNFANVAKSAKFAKFQNVQLDNLVDFEKCCKTHIYLQRSAPIQPKTSEILPKVRLL